MRYVTCAEARPMQGLRLVLSMDGPNPWCEAAKNIFHVRNIDYVPVGRLGMEGNADLLEWTGQPNCPVAMYDEEKPRPGWLEIAYLAERLGTGPSLLPETRQEQVECIGFSHQICGEDGLGWNRRLDIYEMMVAQAEGDIDKVPVPKRLFKDYTITSETMAAGTRRMIDILNLFDKRLELQHSAGLKYLVGDQLTATDIHFASMFGFVDPLPHEVNPMPEWQRALYSSGGPEVRAAISNRLRDHRDFIYDKYLVLPMVI